MKHYNDTSKKVMEALLSQVEQNTTNDLTYRLDGTTVNSFNGYYYVFVGESISVCGEMTKKGILWEIGIQYNACSIDRLNAFFDIVLNSDFYMRYENDAIYDVHGDLMFFKSYVYVDELLKLVDARD